MADPTPDPLRAAAEEALRLDRDALEGPWIVAEDGRAVVTERTEGKRGHIYAANNVNPDCAPFIARARELLPAIARAVLAELEAPDLSPTPEEYALHETPGGKIKALIAYRKRTQTGIVEAVAAFRSYVPPRPDPRDVALAKAEEALRAIEPPSRPPNWHLLDCACGPCLAWRNARRVTDAALAAIAAARGKG